MDCGAGDWTCELFVWLSRDLGNLALQFVLEYGASMFGLIAGAFGIWEFFRHRDRRLHERLKDYIEREERSLRRGSDFLLAEFQRPGLSAQTPKQFFAVPPLRTVLSKRSIAPSITLPLWFFRTNSKLTKAVHATQKRLEDAKRAIALNHSQMFAAHMLRGALASEQANSSQTEAKTINSRNRAISAFQAAMDIPDRAEDPTALLLLARELIMLQQTEEARQYLVRALDAVQRHVDNERKAILAARIRMQLAKIYCELGAGHIILACQTADQSIADYEAASRNEAWDKLELAHANYVAAYARHLNHNNQIESRRIESARQNYEDAEAMSKTWLAVLTWHSRRRGHLYREAAAGQQRVARLLESGQYDLSWLST